MNRKVTIEDIAKELKLAPSTVSRALNNTRPVNQKTKQKILELAEKRGYRPNVMARHLALQTSNLVGLIVPGFNSSLFTEIADAIEKVANDNGYRILLGNTQEKVELQDTYLDLLIEHRVAGVILAPVRGDYNRDHILALKKEHIPLVMFDRYIESMSTNYVVTNNFAGAYMATNHLISLGHRMIAYITEPDQNCTSVIDRTKGYKQALLDNSLPIDEKLIFSVDLQEGHESNGIAQIHKFCLSHPEVTAFFAVNDYYASAVYRVIHMFDLPEFDLVGFDDIRVTPFLQLPFSSVSQSTAKIGTEVAKLLFECIKTNNVSDVRQILIQPKLVIRDTTDRPYPFSVSPLETTSLNNSKSRS